MRKGSIGIFGFVVLVFIAVYGFSVFSIWFSVLGFDIRCRFRFSYLIYFGSGFSSI